MPGELHLGDPGTAGRALPVIAGQAETSMQLVASLLELARVGEAPVRQQVVDPTAMARDIVEQLRLSREEPLPRIVVQDMPAVQAEPAVLHDALAKQTEDDEVCLFVKDNGIGLSIVRRAVDRLGGRVCGPNHRPARAPASS